MTPVRVTLTDWTPPRSSGTSVSETLTVPIPPCTRALALPPLHPSRNRKRSPGISPRVNGKTALMRHLQSCCPSRHAMGLGTGFVLRGILAHSAREASGGSAWRRAQEPLPCGRGRGNVILLRQPEKGSNHGPAHRQ